MISIILYVVFTLVLSQVIAGLLHLYYKNTNQNYGWANYLAAAIIMIIVVIVYELIIEPLCGWLAGLVISLFN